MQYYKLLSAASNWVGLFEFSVRTKRSQPLKKKLMPRIFRSNGIQKLNTTPILVEKPVTYRHLKEWCDSRMGSLSQVLSPGNKNGYGS